MEDSDQYEFTAIEHKWQKFWDDNKSFKTSDDQSKPKYYILDMFPYPSGNGLHVGHAEGYTATDIMARFKRMQGFNVLHPMGWDAFGLPAEQHAIKTNTHPRVTTEKNTNNFRKQIKSLGFSTDWDREISTADPKFYKWTQWIFKKLFDQGLAYESHAPVNWCPKLGTVLANEEVNDGRSEIGNHPVEKKSIRQWVLKITAYAERLLNDLDELDWPESTKEMQRHWIGKSIGANVQFKVAEHQGLQFEVFTTRPDTLFGASFAVLAPEHPLILKICSSSHKDALQTYVDTAKNKSDLQRSSQSKDKTGVSTGAFAINPANEEKIPIFCADYVLMSYGSGAIMAVPGHDSRDHEFAKKHELPIVRVLSGGNESIDEEAHCGDGILVNSDFLDGMKKDQAIDKMCSWLESKGCGKRAISYRLRDWIFSRQRYWGEPFPIIHSAEGIASTVPDSDLPVVLPEVEDYKPSSTGEPPLANAKEWLNYQCADGNFSRETNIMPQWAGSCWYYLRYIDPHNDQEAWGKEKEQHWLPVDLYLGGVEHANLHLLYARFWHKVLYDLGYVQSKEPFAKLRHPGLVLGPDGMKMSKSRGNVVNPDDVIEEWGSDSLRLYEMFMGPLEQVKPWQTSGITGVHRFLKRLWKLICDGPGGVGKNIQQGASSQHFTSSVHKTIKKVSEDIEDLKLNTAISSQMELLNEAYKESTLGKKEVEIMIRLLAPFAPHICEEIWERLGHQESISYAQWPEADSKLIIESELTISIMVNGKFRGTIKVDKSSDAANAITQAKELENVMALLSGKTIKREIYVPGKVVNFVVV